ncbi:MAG: hypothetical protein CM1200mP27_12780 [Chloroflexota bacterium]|nr:MAG: hypothetical protein CM1200mP27_12780 [Chloroflexota bacterium]
MGGHASFAFGLAMSRPDEKIILFDSEGDILMNMGALTTIAKKILKTFTISCWKRCLCHNWGQPVPNAEKFSMTS